MNTQKFEISRKRRIESIIIFVFCAVVAICVTSFLLFCYKPGNSALGALATVCMDVLCMAALIILVIGVVLEKDKLSQTTKLFLGLMLVTMIGLFFDFLTWANDGALNYDGWTYIFTCTSLCTGSVLAGVFGFYLERYMNDVHELRSSFKRAKICGAVNAAAFVLTLILAITKTAFTFVDGHYETGTLYSIVTAIPVLTLIYMTGYVIKNVKIIGAHDVSAVVGYILIMVCGALIETKFRIGTTYVSVALANIYIFMMLQNNRIDSAKKQREALSERVSNQYEVLKSMADIYTYVSYVNLDEKNLKRNEQKFDKDEKLNIGTDSYLSLTQKLYEGMEEGLKDNFKDFTDLSTLPLRMEHEKVIAADFCHETEGWFRAHYIRIGASVNEPIKKAIFATRNIDEEKKNVEQWIRKSNTDDMTGFYNRFAYENEIALIEKEQARTNLVYVSMDVNGLKIVNDNLGHDAGDELILGACEVMKQCLGPYGKPYRTGGDEFVALIYVDDEALERIQTDMTEVAQNWHGELNEHVNISCGYVTEKESVGMTLHQIAVLADKKMYDNKTKYYRKKGVDRRGQRDAHVALCALYTKIIKVNLTDDTYEIINIPEAEKGLERGFADTFSEWVDSFCKTGQVHAIDLSEFRAKTNTTYLKKYFESGNTSLKVFYRRIVGDEYRKVMLEIIPSNDYKDESQNLFLYVKLME